MFQREILQLYYYYFFLLVFNNNKSYLKLQSTFLSEHFYVVPKSSLIFISLDADVRGHLSNLILQQFGYNSFVTLVTVDISQHEKAVMLSSREYMTQMNFCELLLVTRPCNYRNVETRQYVNVGGNMLMSSGL